MREIEFPIPLTEHEKALITAIATAEGYDNPEDYMPLVIEDCITELSRALDLHLSSKRDAPSAPALH